VPTGARFDRRTLALIRDGKILGIRASVPRELHRSERLRKAVDRAYVAKFRTPWAAKLAREFVPGVALRASRGPARPRRA